MTQYVKLSKLRIAEIQLEQSLKLYMDGTDLVSTITLAGAAEEVLGKLVKAQGATTALEDKVNDLCEMFSFVFDDEPDPKAFVNIRNQARNDFKHLTRGEEKEFDLEQEAVNMLKRAIGNYMKLVPGSRQKFWKFEKEHVRRWRTRTNDYAQQVVEPDA